ncbi:hypothetical protein [Gordonia aichiensis]|uniref:hypothetical protein n=1 Tax=Gordonia aichiensis TaxID=36820 RepID=UPI003265CED0
MAGAVAVLSAALVATAACSSGSSMSTDSQDASTASSSVSSMQPVPTQGGTAPTQPGTEPVSTDGQLGSVQTVQGEGFTARIQVKNEPRRTVTSNGKTDLLVFDVVIDIQSGQLKPLYTSWRLVTGSSEYYSRTPSDLPNALGNAPIDHHAEGVIAFANPKLQDSVTIDRIELFDKLSPSTSDEPAVQWRAPSPILIGALPIMKS